MNFNFDDSQDGLEYDDILIVPQPSCVLSRGDVDISSYLGKGLKLNVPIIASPMPDIVGPKMIREISLCGGIGIMHRFYYDNQDNRVKDLESLSRDGVCFGVAVELFDSFYTNALHAGASIICVDVANGYLNSVRDFCEEIGTFIERGKFRCSLMAGNVATYEGANNLYSSGVGIIRVGIGSGGLCTTRNVTGVGVPQATAVKSCSSEKWNIVADGGIRSSGDAVKALALGADAVMVGSVLGSCEESENNGEMSGSASKKLQEQFYGRVKKSIEGTTKKVEKTTTIESLMNDYSWGIRSACTYINARNLAELRKNTTFIRTGKGSIR